MIPLNIYFWKNVEYLLMLPKYNLLYYKALLDKCFARFFDEYNDKFIKNDK
jgi:hypothetical protein